MKSEGKSEHPRRMKDLSDIEVIYAPPRRPIAKAHTHPLPSVVVSRGERPKTMPPTKK